MRIRLRLSDDAAVPSLESHLAAEGFPATVTPAGELDVLFPGVASIFAPAVELDLWRTRHGAVEVTVEPAEER